MTAMPQPGWGDVNRAMRTALGVGVGGAVLCAVGSVFNPDQFFHSYLTAFTSWVGIAVGSLALWMIHNLTGGHWGYVLRRFLEAAARTLPLLLLAFVPLALDMPAIWSWAGPGEGREHNPRPEWLNVSFFLIRTGVYFAAWLILAFFLNRWSARQDQSADPWPAERMEALSGPGLAVYGLTVTFAAIDWIMSLDPHWYSTIFGAIVASGQLLPAMGLAIAMATCFAGQEPLKEIVNADVWNDLGSMLLAFVMFWAYMMFSQLLLVWSGNLPEEISWYVIRSEGGWQWVAVLLAVFYFALPFVVLLNRSIKRHPHRLRVVALAVVVMSFVNQHWMIAPVFSPSHFYVHWMDLAALAGLGGFWFAYYLRQLQARPLVPVHRPASEEAVNHA